MVREIFECSRAASSVWVEFLNFQLLPIVEEVNKFWGKELYIVLRRILYHDVKNTVVAGLIVVWFGSVLRTIIKMLSYAWRA